MKEMERARSRNPVGREPGQLTEAEQEVERLAESGEAQGVEAYSEVVHQYWAPFNYPNIKVELGRTDPYVGAEFNCDGAELDIPPRGAITIVEEEPIVGVTVIGSACVPPGFVFLQAEPLEWKFPRTGVKMKIDNLWGQHIRWDQWLRGTDEGWRDAGLSCADFHIPESAKVTIMAGSQMDVDAGLAEARQGHDAHYCIRIIRVTVKLPLQHSV
jgi:hypothetical protein